MEVKMFLRDIDAEYPLSVMVKRMLSEAQIHYGQSPYWARAWAGEYRRGPIQSEKKNELRYNDTPSDVEIESRVRRWRIREEDFGGLFFDPVTRVVLKGDKEAYAAALALRQDNVEQVSKEAIEALLTETRRAYDGVY